MYFTFEEFQKKYRTSNESIRTFVDAEHIPDFVEKTANEICMPDIKTPILTRMIIGLTLGIVNKNQIEELITNDIGQQVDTKILVNKIYNFLLENRIAPKIDQITESAPQPITRKELMQSLSAKRTMQNDIAELDKTADLEQATVSPEKEVGDSITIPKYSKPLTNSRTDIQ